MSGYESVKEIFRCFYCKDSGLVFAKDTDERIYVFLHACKVGKERKEKKIPYWTSDKSTYYEPISNRFEESLFSGGNNANTGTEVREHPDHLQAPRITPKQT